MYRTEPRSFECVAYCEVCGNDADNCICPECPVCEEQGNILCYTRHGLLMTQDQLDCRRAHEAELARMLEDFCPGFIARRSPA